MAKITMPRLRGPWLGFFLGVVVVAAMFAASTLYPKTLEFFELKAFDIRMYAGGKRPISGQVAIIAIDDKSIEELGRWPWPRSVMAKLVDALRDYRVAVIGFDLIFSEADNQDVQRNLIAARLRADGISEAAISAALGAPNDEAFARALADYSAAYFGFPFEGHRLSGRRNEPLLTGFVREIRRPAPLEYNLVRASGPTPQLLSAESYLPPLDMLNRAAKGTGYEDVDADADGVSRTEFATITFHGRYCVPFYLALVSAYRSHAPLSVVLNEDGVSRVAVGEEEIPVDEKGRMWVNFRGPTGTIPSYSVADVFSHRIPALALGGKIVLVGVTGKGLGDRKVTPVDADIPGVEVHANAVDSVLRGDFVHRSKLTESEERVFAFVLGILVSLVVAHISAGWSFLGTLLLALGYFFYAQERLAMSGTLLKVVFPLSIMAAGYVVVATYRYLTEGLEKRRIRHAFEHYLNPDVIASVVDNPEGLKLGGERRHLSILFADIVGFTTRAERSPSPEALIAELNTYFTRMLDLILQSGGVVDKLIGDAIMAFWGAPAEVADPAKLALDTAINMLNELAKLKAEDKRFADFDIGVGISTGEPVVGNLGGEKRFDYSVIGDCVNFASRLEGLTRKFGVHLLVSQQTLDEAVKAGGRYVSRNVGLVAVKGKHEELPIVEIVGRADDGIDLTFYQRFASVRDLIKQGENRRAVEQLQQLKLLREKDHLIEMYLEQLNNHLATGQARPLTEMVFIFDTK